MEPTKPSEYLYHQVYLGEKENTLVVWLRDADRAFTITARNVREVPQPVPVSFVDYWQDYVTLDVIQNFYQFMDSEAKRPENVHQIYF